MILKVSANQPTFKTVEFSTGPNIVWADRTKESTKKETRNGLGKSTLIEIIHFCLGSTPQKNKGLLVKFLSGWEFSVELSLNRQSITISRNTDNPGCVYIDGNMTSWPITPKIDKKNGRLAYNVREWNSLLGFLFFGLPLDEQRQYQPSFRSLISFFIRRQKDAYITPFEHYRKQQEWDKQVNNAFLLGLSWENASQFQVLRDRKNAIQSFKKAAKSGIIQNYSGSLGDLEAQKIRLKQQSDIEQVHLRSFRVHPQYQKIHDDTNSLTEEIHELINSNIFDQQMLLLYEKSLNDEKPPSSDTIANLYEEAGVALPGVTLRRLDEVRTFHEQIIENRRNFLSFEIERLKHAMHEREVQLKNKTEERGSLLEVLKTHGALEEYVLLEKQFADTVGKLNAVTNQIENIKSFEKSESELKVAQELLYQRARLEYDERYSMGERAISIFNSYSEFLYNVPGTLVIDIDNTGFKFDVEIERSGSSGIDNMKIFCYDLMLARIWAEHDPSPRLLIHDSTIFDGVDERQRALALELAFQESKKFGFQYICTLNSDYIPWKEFSPDFDFKKYIKLTLTDEKIDGCLLGIRY